MTDFNPFAPTTGQAVLNAAPVNTHLYLYSDLARDPREAVDIISSLGRNSIILYQDPSRMNSGHWVSLALHPERKEAYFFSSYGGKPDEEKNRWISQQQLASSGQARNVLNDGLKEYMKKGWEIHYNDFPFQKAGDQTATCGVWSTAFLNEGVDPDEFVRRRKSARDYFFKYFSRRNDRYRRKREKLSMRGSRDDRARGTSVLYTTGGCDPRYGGRNCNSSFDATMVSKRK